MIRLAVSPSRCRPTLSYLPGQAAPAVSRRIRAVLAGSSLARPSLAGSLLPGEDRLRHGPGKQLGHVHHPERLFRLARALLRADRIAEHHQAEWAARGDRIRVGTQRLVDSLDVDPLADPLFHPHPGTAGAAAEAALLAPVHFLRLHAGHVLHDLPRRGEDPVVPAEEARVLIGNLLVDRRHGGEPAVGD